MGHSAFNPNLNTLTVRLTSCTWDFYFYVVKQYINSTVRIISTESETCNNLMTISTTCPHFLPNQRHANNPASLLASQQQTALQISSKHCKKQFRKS